MSLQSLIDNFPFSGTKLTIVSAMSAAGVLAYYGYPPADGGWFFRYDLTIWQNIGLYMNAGFLMIGLLKSD